MSNAFVVACISHSLLAAGLVHCIQLLRVFGKEELAYISGILGMVTQLDLELHHESREPAYLLHVERVHSKNVHERALAFVDGNCLGIKFSLTSLFHACMVRCVQFLRVFGEEELSHIGYIRSVVAQLDLELLHETREPAYPLNLEHVHAKDVHERALAFVNSDCPLFG